jgi:signal transduction histidine kinase
LILRERLELEICDDGRGLSEQEMPGVGLHAMRERAAELGGSCVIESLAGQGTCVRAWLPMN